MQWGDLVPEGDANRALHSRDHLTLLVLELARRHVRSHGGSVPFYSGA